MRIKLFLRTDTFSVYKAVINGYEIFLIGKGEEALTKLIWSALYCRLIPANLTKTAELGATRVNDGMTAGQGVGVEIILTFVLVIVIFGTTDPNRPSFGSPSLLIGLTVTLLHLIGVSRHSRPSIYPTSSG